jgi:hypothetical protein
MNVENKNTGEVTSTGSWLSDTLRQFSVVALIREQIHIRRICAESLRVYRQFKAEMPNAAPKEIYARMIEKRSGAGAAGVREILRRIEQSFTEWPVDREITLREVVSFFAVTDCLNADPSAIGVRSRVRDVVANAIPSDL